VGNFAEHTWGFSTSPITVEKDGEMAYLIITSPEMLASTAADVESIGSAISTASANAAAPTTGVLAAAEDEVSAAIANLFGRYGREYQAVVSQAVVFHSEFTRAVAAAANTYAQAEAANAALMSGISNELGGPMQTPSGQTPIASGGSGGTSTLTSVVKSASGDPLIALIMGGTGMPLPKPNFVTGIDNAYLTTNARLSTATPEALFTPEQYFPLGRLTLGQSVSQGVTLLNNALLGPTGVLTQGNSAVVVGFSQSCIIETEEIRALLALPAAQQPSASQLSFIFLSDPNNPDGGLLACFPGFYIPIFDVPFDGATPQSPWPTTVYISEYEGVTDFPRYPLNVVSDLNAIVGTLEHPNYAFLTANQVANAVPLPTSGGNTEYFMFLRQNLPLLDPIRLIPFVGNPIADLLQPDLRVIVDLGYSGFGPGADFANIPTPAQLFSVPDPFTVIPDLAIGAVQGVQAALVDLGLLPTSALPNAYPYLPSINPQLHFFFGQPSTTGVSIVSGALGDVFRLIPPLVLG
jgi:hypothetical protein